jgi:peptide deformylase
MAILEIKKYPDPVLKKKAGEVKAVNDEIRNIIDDMKETMKESNGVGLAAPQVGISKRIIVVDLEFLKQGTFELVNPKITGRSKETDMDEEGCLSFPNVFLKIKRSKKVEVLAKDRDGKEITIKASGLSARVLAHEIDHLDGILFFDRLPLARRLKFKLFKKF